MNKLNPIYILALVVTVFIISITLVNDKEKEFKSLDKNFNSFEIKAEKYNEYKTTWFNNKQVIKKLDAIVKSSSFRKEKILKTQNENLIKVKIESNNPKVLNKFLNRVLNERFRIKNLNIEKKYILLEIGLK